MAKNTINNDEFNQKSFLHYQSKIIVGLYTYLQEFSNKDIEALFSNAIYLFNALGSWKYVEPLLKSYIQNFKHLLKKQTNVLLKISRRFWITLTAWVISYIKF